LEPQTACSSQDCSTISIFRLDDRPWQAKAPFLKAKAYLTSGTGAESAKKSKPKMRIRARRGKKCDKKYNRKYVVS
jgi:hypothetical protein